MRSVWYRCLLCLILGTLFSCSEDKKTATSLGEEVRRLESSLRVVLELESYALLGSWGHEAEAWFVGGTGDSPDTSRGIIAHLDEGKIRQEVIPSGGLLWWVFGFEANQVWAVGEGGRILRRAEGVWTEEYRFEDDKAVLYGVWGSSPTDLWAVGGSVRRNGPKGLVLRSQGDGVWTRLDDKLFPEDLNFYKVWGRSSDDVMLVGEGGLAVHWDGQAFRRTTTGINDILFTVFGLPGASWFAVGGANQGQVISAEDGEWQTEAIPASPGLNGVTMRDDGWALVVGNRATVLLRSPEEQWGSVNLIERMKVGGRTIHSVWTGKKHWLVGGDMTNMKRGFIISDESTVTTEKFQ